MKPYQTPKSDQMAEAGRKVIPAATMSNFRRSVDYHPIYMTHGKGARLYDVDGNEYIDYSMSYGPALLGHSNEHMREALRRQLERLYTPNVNDLEVKAAQKVIDHIASAELVRFTCSGTEANISALRAARAFTGRTQFVRFNGHYHGGNDDLMGGILGEVDRPYPVEGELENDFYSQFTNTQGRHPGAFEQVFMIEWNDLDVLKKLFNQYSHEIAALIMEPTMVNNFGCLPEAGYLEGVRDLCTKHGVVLIFDEVLTGFRIDLKSAQGYFGITPDMTTLAKAVGGGFPVSAFTGKREIMDTLTRADAVVGGTYNGHPLAMAAVIAAIEEYERSGGEIYSHIRQLGTMLKEGVDQIASENEQPILLQGFPGAWTFCFNAKKKIINQSDGLDSNIRKFGRFAELLKKHGIITSWRFCVSAAHTEKDINDTLEQVNEVMKIMRDDDAAGPQDGPVHIFL